jgi:Zn-dependent protease
MRTKQGAFKLFSLAGIGVYVHWMWFLAAVYSLQTRGQVYSSFIWNVVEYLALFAIVLMHEFGHQLACRSVGGQTHDIVLWLLGGVAFVSPPQRPGAQLWSIVAGPLVNVALIPVFSAFIAVSWHLGWEDTHPDAYKFFHNWWTINIIVLIFNMMPVYPLDGGQILRSLLWFPFGRANSLLIASIIGFIGVGGLIILDIRTFLNAQDAGEKEWAFQLALMTAFIVMSCWHGLKQALALSRVAKLPRRDGFACPACKSAPPQGAFWRCGKCGQSFDPFQTLAVCPHCATQFSSTQCLDCGASRPIGEWSAAPLTNHG